MMISIVVTDEVQIARSQLKTYRSSGPIFFKGCFCVFRFASWLFDWTQHLGTLAWTPFSFNNDYSNNALRIITVTLQKLSDVMLMLAVGEGNNKEGQCLYGIFLEISALS